VQTARTLYTCHCTIMDTIDKPPALLVRMRTGWMVWSGGGVLLILVLMPFHATLSVWVSQLTGHYTVVRLWKELVLGLLTAGAACRLWRDAALRRRFRCSRLLWCMAAYAAVQLVWGLAAYRAHGVTRMALGYGWLVDLRFLVFFADVWVIASAVPVLAAHWPKVVFWPLAAVVAAGLLQYFVLPYDFLSHLGYSAATIFPYQDINHNTHYIRIMSTLRGANPLGAYLVAALALLLAYRRLRRVWWWALLAGGLLVLALSFSRGAWAGCAVSIAIILAATVSRRTLRIVLLGAGAAVLCLGAGLVLARNNTTLQNIVLHTQNHSAVRTTSNAGHVSALQNGLQDVMHEPLGRGPGTAGPASAYNTGHPVRIAENYFIQIAQETGWPGIALFGLTYVLVARLLWRQRHTALGIGLFAGMMGISVAGLFGHVWADDTLAYFWWGLAGIALAPAVSARKSSAP